MDHTSAVDLYHVKKVFKEETVLKGITHSFAAGQVHGLVGMNGSGKTVLLKCICGFLKPTEGEIWVMGKQIGKDVDFPESVGAVIESPGFLPRMSGYQNLRMLAGIRGKISDKRIRKTMQRVGLDPDSKKHVEKYSMGMRERLGIAQAIMENPRLLILDEPFNGLDKRGVQEIYDLIWELQESGKTIFLVSHNRVDIDTLCNTVCEMDGGKLSQIR